MLFALHPLAANPKCGALAETRESAEMVEETGESTTCHQLTHPREKVHRQWNPALSEKKPAACQDSTAGVS